MPVETDGNIKWFVVVSMLLKCLEAQIIPFYGVQGQKLLEEYVVFRGADSLTGPLRVPILRIR